MSEPIKSKRLGDLPGAPTPQNTPSTAVSSFATRGAVQPKISTIKEEDAANLVSNPALLSMIEGRLSTLVGASSGYIESLPQNVKDRISALKAVQAQHAELESAFQMELLELEKKYFAKYTPLYQRRAEIVNGRVEPTDAEINSGKEIEEAEKEDLGTIEEEDEEEEKEQKEQAPKDESAEPLKGIPEFWLTALKNLGPVAETITDRDDEALKFLTDIRMQYLDKPGFSLVFEFDENPFFTNKTLVKSYYYQEEPGYGGDFIYDRAEGTEIKWVSPETNLCARIEKRKQRNKHTKATRTVEKLIPTESFFDFFSPPRAPSDDDEEEDLDEIDPTLEERLEVDYQLGEEIKEKLIPRAVDWFTGAALAYEGLDDEDFDGEDFEGLSGDEDDSDDSDDSDESADNDGTTKAEKPECNQQ